MSLSCNESWRQYGVTKTYTNTSVATHQRTMWNASAVSAKECATKPPTSSSKKKAVSKAIMTLMRVLLDHASLSDAMINSWHTALRCVVVVPRITTYRCSERQRCTTFLPTGVPRPFEAMEYAVGGRHKNNRQKNNGSRPSALVIPGGVAVPPAATASPSDGARPLLSAVFPPPTRMSSPLSPTFHNCTEPKEAMVDPPRPRYVLTCIIVEPRKHECKRQCPL